MLFVLANVTLFCEPLDKLKELIFSFPSIKAKFLFSDFFPLFLQINGYMIILVFFLLLCSVYFSIQFIRKDSSDKKLFDLIPNNTSGFFALLVIVISSIYIKMILAEFMTYL